MIKSLRGVAKIRINDLQKLEKNVRASFSIIKEEMEDHLQSINENTVEVSNNLSRVSSVEQKLDKLSERIDEIHLLFRQIASNSQKSISLTLDEQKVFLILYTNESFMSPQSISQKFGLDVDLVFEGLLSMSDKGVPLDKQLINGMQYFKISSNFKESQAKEEIVKIDVSVRGQFQNKLLNKFFEE